VAFARRFLDGTAVLAGISACSAAAFAALKRISALFSQRLLLRRSSRRRAFSSSVRIWGPRWLKQPSRSSSFFRDLQSAITFATGGFGFGSAGTLAIIAINPLSLCVFHREAIASYRFSFEHWRWLRKQRRGLNPKPRQPLFMFSRALL
jgi:hypothetical protein